MRLAILHPTYWPEVRRGSERIAHDLATTLAARGHEVSLITSHKGARTCDVEDGVRVVRCRRLPELPGVTWYYDEHLPAVPAMLRELLESGAELAHALHPTDGVTAMAARGLGGPPYLLSIHGVLNRHWLVRRRRRLQLLERAARGAGAVSALSEAGREPLVRYAIADPLLLPGGVIAADYRGEREAEPELLLCPASLDDPRKRGTLLLEAFALLHRDRPGLRLRLAGGADPRQTEPVDLDAGGSGDAVEVVRISDSAELARAYRRAAVTVLPSDDEAFGLVLIESLAAGTPVVAARAGGCVEIVTDDGLGRLFEPGDAGDLARAIGEALELSADPETAARCREHASAWDWSRVAERYERAYELVLSARRAST